VNEKSEARLARGVLVEGRVNVRMEEVIGGQSEEEREMRSAQRF
jgi:hypothetical protein